MANLRTAIIDDSEDVRARIKATLEGIEGIEVIGEAIDGFTGLELILNQDPEFVIIDAQMPKMSGEEVLQKLSSYGIELDIIILAENNADFEQLLEKFKELGANDVIMKPHDEAVLIKLSKKILKNR